VGKETIIGAHSTMEVLNEVITALNANQITLQLAKRNRPAMPIAARERKSRTATALWEYRFAILELTKVLCSVLSGITTAAGAPRLDHSFSSRSRPASTKPTAEDPALFHLSRQASSS
jgi:hypothetical protein